MYVDKLEFPRARLEPRTSAEILSEDGVGCDGDEVRGGAWWGWRCESTARGKGEWPGPLTGWEMGLCTLIPRIPEAWIWVFVGGSVGGLRPEALMG
jgi:hypothetical protein